MSYIYIIVSEPEHCHRRGFRAYRLHEVKSVSALGLTWAYIGSVAMAIGLLTLAPQPICRGCGSNLAMTARVTTMFTTSW